MQWVLQNKEWVFSGAGLFLLGCIGGAIRLLLRRHDRENEGIVQSQRAGHASTNVQIGKIINNQ
jgi:hypothetical protein